MKEIKKSGGRKACLRSYIKIAFFSFLACLSVGMCLFSSLFFDGYSEYRLIEIPSFVGKLREDIRVPDGVELFWGYEYADEKDVGRVIYQSACGEKKSRGDYPLYIKIGREREKFNMPSLYGKKKDDAVKIIESLGGVARIEYIDEGESGRVAYQSPTVGTSLYVGDRVTVFVSKKSDMESVIVRDFEGLSFSEAIFQIRESGLTIGDISYTSCDDTPIGVVLSQSLPFGAYVKKGRKINLTVSKKSEINQMKESHKNIWMTKKRAE